jgi:16S rRNA (uracil1498-N3)-methyltransferase
MAHRYYLDPGAWDDAPVTLNPEESHHLARVLRVTPGAVLELFDGAGGLGRGEVVAVRKNAVAVRVLERGHEPGPARHVTLFQALPKGQGLDGILQKAVELGAAAVVPVWSERVAQRPAADRAAEREARWRRVALEAAKQCETAWVPRIGSTQDIIAVAAAVSGFDLFLVGSLRADARPFRSVLRERMPAEGTRLGLLIGPEGDLTPAELDAVQGAGAVPVSFGRLTLRVETAAVFGLAAIAYESL